MPRTARYIVPGSVYHLISRFVDREWFIRGTTERNTYLTLLGRALDTSDWRCIAYAIMSNHIHVAAIAGELPLGDFMREANGAFAQWMNKRHGRLGSVFVRGPSDGHVPPDRVRNVVAYIHNNPVRAGVVRSAGETDWTSHRAYVGTSDAPRWLAVADGLARCGFDDPRAFDRWVGADDSQVCVPDLTAIQKSARRRGALELGTPTIGEQGAVPIVMRPWARVLPDPREVIDAVATAIGITTFELSSRTKARAIVLGKRMALWCGQRVGLTTSDVARALGLTQQAGSRLLQKSIDSDALACCVRIVNKLNRRVQAASEAERRGRSQLSGRRFAEAGRKL